MHHNDQCFRIFLSDLLSKFVLEPGNCYRRFCPSHLFCLGKARKSIHFGGLWINHNSPLCLNACNDLWVGSGGNKAGHPAADTLYHFG